MKFEDFGIKFELKSNSSGKRYKSIGMYRYLHSIFYTHYYA